MLINLFCLPTSHHPDQRWSVHARTEIYHSSCILNPILLLQIISLFFNPIYDLIRGDLCAHSFPGFSQYMFTECNKKNWLGRKNWQKSGKNLGRMIRESKAVQIQHLVVSRPPVSWARTIVETDD